MPDKVTEIYRLAASLPEQVQDRILAELQGATLALEVLTAPPVGE